MQVFGFGIKLHILNGSTELTIPAVSTLIKMRCSSGGEQFLVGRKLWLVLLRLAHSKKCFFDLARRILYKILINSDLAFKFNVAGSQRRVKILHPQVLRERAFFSSQRLLRRLRVGQQRVHACEPHERQSRDV